MSAKTAKQEAQVQIAVRVPESWLGRFDKAAERLSQPGAAVTRAGAIRRAMYRGLVDFEAESKKR